MRTAAAEAIDEGGESRSRGSARRTADHSVGRVGGAAAGAGAGVERTFVLRRGGRWPLLDVAAGAGAGIDEFLLP